MTCEYPAPQCCNCICCDDALHQYWAVAMTGIKVEECEDCGQLNNSYAPVYFDPANAPCEWYSSHWCDPVISGCLCPRVGVSIGCHNTEPGAVQITAWLDPGGVGTEVAWTRIVPRSMCSAPLIFTSNDISYLVDEPVCDYTSAVVVIGPSDVACP